MTFSQLLCLGFVAEKRREREGNERKIVLGIGEKLIEKHGRILFPYFRVMV